MFPKLPYLVFAIFVVLVSQQAIYFVDTQTQTPPVTPPPTVAPATTSTPSSTTTAAQGQSCSSPSSCQAQLNETCRGNTCGCKAGFTRNSSNDICAEDNRPFERVPEDGWFNNLIHPDWGAIDGDLLRRSKTAYSDGVYEPSGKHRPNPFLLSQYSHNGTSGRPSSRNRTAFVVFFGQQLVEEILDAQRAGCPREFVNIPVPVPHPYNPNNLTNLEMPFLRSRYNARTGYSPNNPRQQLNEITPYIDGNLMYGSGKAWADTLRSFRNGRLAQRDESLPIRDSIPIMNDIRLPMASPPITKYHRLEPVERYYRIGNPRGNENPFLLSFGILWFRYHNYIADKLFADHPNWSDERLYDEARKRLIAQYQKIVFKEWLPTWLGVDPTGRFTAFDPVEFSYKNGSKNPYNGYNPNVHPGISAEFQSAAFRFGHTLVVSGVFTRTIDNQCQPTEAPIDLGSNHKVKGIRTCNSFWRPQDFVVKEGDKPGPGIDSILLGMATTYSEREDRIIVTDLRQNVFGPLDWSRRDLPAVNIQRGRDHGLPGYNDVREAYGLARKKTFQEIASEVEQVSGVTNPELVRDLKEALQKIDDDLFPDTDVPDDLDVFPGGMLETTENGPGELFRTIIIDQFLRIRHGDRFWYENWKENGLFTQDDINEIEATTMRDVLLAVTNIREDLLQPNPFRCNGDTRCECMAPFNTSRFGGDLEECSPLLHYDYFSGSEVSFAVSFLILFLAIPITIGVMLLMVKQRENSLAAQARRRPDKMSSTETTFSATEWLGTESGDRSVLIELVATRKKIMVQNPGTKTTVRLIDLRQKTNVIFLLNNDRMVSVLSLKVPGETDLILDFNTGVDRSESVRKLEVFLQGLGIRVQTQQLPTAQIYKEAETYDLRKKLLEKFFRGVTLQVFKDSKGQGLGDLDAETSAKIRDVKLTRSEFAESMGLQPNSMFVRNMFLLVDRSRDGFVSFDEFMSMFLTMANGTAKDKAKMLFDMYDLRGRGYLSREDFDKFIRSMLDLADAAIDNDERVKQLIQAMFEQAGIKDKTTMTFDDFCKIFASEEYGSLLNDATLGINVGGKPIAKAGKGGRGESMNDRRRTVLMRYQGSKKASTPKDVASRNRMSRITVRTHHTEYPSTPNQRRIQIILRTVQNYRLQIFWVTLYTLVNFGIFIERAYYYSVEREHAGLRRLAGHGVSITRGAASSMMFTYASLVVTMSRNTLTFFRETFLHRFIPFDSFHAMHKYIAFWALLATLMHCIGHGINLYHICTQASEDLNCYFTEYFRSQHVLASFHYWTWTTITGLTGVALTLIVIVMYVFAIEYSRRHLFKAFWTTHSLYIPLYFLLFLHGAARLVQDPIWGWYFIGPVVIYVLDKLVSISRNKLEISVKSASLLPSGVLQLVFRKPLNFEYKSGQWVRIACLDLASNEYHPFTLTSAPHEENLSLHIRAVGPWTNNIRRVYDASLYPDRTVLPKLYLDGPFGEGHQDWYRFPVSVLVGGGIGVTPFASILKDLVLKSKLKLKFPCQKVYFFWVTRTQKSFEWMTDIIREVELGDDKLLVDVHIFITQFQQKFDLRTTMLYICERHFQRIEGQSLFTGLRAITHFGRPQFEHMFRSIGDIHKEAGQIGVFSCGPPRMTLSVEKACSAMNRLEGASFHHHFENF